MNVGRNEPCPCGSGKKYKKCCLAKDEETARLLRETAARLAASGVTGDPLLDGREEADGGETDWDGEEDVPEDDMDPAWELAYMESFEEFIDADYEERFQRWTEGLGDREVFGVEHVETWAPWLLCDAVDHGQPERFDAALAALHKERPELFDAVALLLIELQMESAWIQDDAAALCLAVEAYVDRTDAPDDIAALLDRLSFHGEKELVLHVTARTSPDPFAQEPSPFMPEQRRRAMRLAFYYELEKGGPEALQAPKSSAMLLANLLRDDPLVAAFDPAHEPRASEEARLARLAKAVLFTQWQEHAIPCITSDLGVLAIREMSSDPQAPEPTRDTRGRRRAAGASRHEETNTPRYPDADRLNSWFDRLLEEKEAGLDTMEDEDAAEEMLDIPDWPYRFIALLEMLPIWMRTLETHGLCTPAEQERVLHEVAPLISRVRSELAENHRDPLLRAVLDDWPAAALQRRQPLGTRALIDEAHQTYRVRQRAIYRAGIDWSRAVPLGYPSADFLGEMDLTWPGGITEALDAFIERLETDFYLTWEAAIRSEQGLPLVPAQRLALEVLIDLSEDEDDEILTVDEQGRPIVPWYTEATQLAAALCLPPGASPRTHLDEVYLHGWSRLALGLHDHAQTLSLPDGVDEPLDVVPPTLQQALWVQSAVMQLLGIAIALRDRDPNDAALKDMVEGEIDDFCFWLAEAEGTLNADFALSLNQLLDRLALPAAEREPLAGLLCEGLSITDRDAPISER